MDTSAAKNDDIVPANGETGSFVTPLPHQKELGTDNKTPSEECAPKSLLAKLEQICQGVSIKLGPFEVRPALHQEVPIGRAYQPVQVNSVSRLQGFIGRDEFSLYIREVPENPGLGLRPSKNGIWVRQLDESEFRRLAPGEGARIYADSDVRVGGNGKSGASGLQIDVS